MSQSGLPTSSLGSEGKFLMADFMSDLRQGVAEGLGLSQSDAQRLLDRAIDRIGPAPLTPAVIKAALTDAAKDMMVFVDVDTVDVDRSDRSMTVNVTIGQRLMDS